jgi:hypothetical protein
MPDNERHGGGGSDKPKWTGNHPLSYVSKLRSYCDEMVKTGIYSRLSVHGRPVNRYQVSVTIVFDMTSDQATRDGMIDRDEYKAIAKKVYNRINFSMPEGGQLLSSIRQDDGRGALMKLTEKLGDETNQLTMLEAELTALNLISQSGFFDFENSFGGIVREWQLLCRNTRSRSIARERLTSGRLRRTIMEKIRMVFPEVYRDASKPRNRDTYQDIMVQCKNLAVLSARTVQPTSHASVGSDPYDWTSSYQGGLGYDGKGSYPQSYFGKGSFSKGGAPKGKGGYSKGSRVSCSNCGTTGHRVEYCAQPGGKFQGDLHGAMNASRAARGVAKKGKGGESSYISPPGKNYPSVNYSHFNPEHGLEDQV